jgi:acyl-CoA synthetase (AMP-forming)/AMP-acid ligase II
MTIDELKQLKGIFPNSDIYKTYGQTETFRSTILMPEEFEKKTLSVGRPRDTEIFIITKDGSIAKPNEEGEVIHSGHGTMLQYLNDPDETEKKLRPHPFLSSREKVIYTGDIGKFDEDGFLYIAGRNDSMLKIQGNRVYPEEIENAIREHHEIQECVIYESTKTNQLVAVLQMKKDHKNTKQDIYTF